MTKKRELKSKIKIKKKKKNIKIQIKNVINYIKKYNKGNKEIFLSC